MRSHSAPSDSYRCPCSRSRSKAIEIGGIDPLALQPLGDIGHVIAGVAVLGRLFAPHPRRQRLGEAGDLAAGVVDVVLAPDLVAGRLEQPHQRVAVGGVTAGADVDRPGRVGGDELDEDLLRRRDRARSEVFSGGEQVAQRPQVPGVGEEEVDEPRPGDLDPLQPACQALVGFELAAQALGHRPRIVAHRPGEEHRRIGAVIAELGLRRALQGGRRLDRLAVAQGTRGTLHRASQRGY